MPLHIYKPLHFFHLVIPLVHTLVVLCENMLFVLDIYTQAYTYTVYTQYTHTIKALVCYNVIRTKSLESTMTRNCKLKYDNIGSTIREQKYVLFSY